VSDLILAQNHVVTIEDIFIFFSYFMVKQKKQLIYFFHVKKEEKAVVRQPLFVLS